MKFCKNCSKTLTLFDDSREELCVSCRETSAAKTSANSPPASASYNALHSATLTCRDGKIILESEEGWLLWSGNAGASHRLEHILARSSRILDIRSRKKK